MPVTIQADQHDSDSSSHCPYDYMETFIDYESNEGSVLFCSTHGSGDVWYESDKMTPEQWDQIVELDKEIMDAMNGFINRAVEILGSQQKEAA